MVVREVRKLRRWRVWLWGPAWQRRVNARLWSREANTWSQSSARGKRFTRRPTYWWLRARGQLAERARPVSALTRGSKGEWAEARGFGRVGSFSFFYFLSLDFRFKLLPKFKNWEFEFHFMLGISHSNWAHKKLLTWRNIFIHVYFFCIFFSLSILFSFLISLSHLNFKF
jgi:hypothetical protein